MYIATNGELRVTIPWQSEELTKNYVMMINISNQAAAGKQLCLLASTYGSHFLADSKDTGRLVTIRNNS